MSRTKRKSQKRIRLIQSGETARALATATPAPASPTNITQGDYEAGSQPPALYGGRQTQPTNVNPLGMLSYSFLPRRQYQDLDLTDLHSLGRGLSAQQMLEMFADLSPHVSKALGNKVLSVNSGYTYQVKTKDGKRDLTRAKALLEEIIEGLNKDAGGIDALIDSWTATVVLQGAATAELALTEDLADIEDVYAIQPWSIYFQRDAEQNLVPYQRQVMTTYGGANGQNAQGGVYGYPFKRLNPLTFCYIPYQNFPDDPYGRSPIASVLQVIAFDLQMQKDLQRWAHVNAWGRMDVEILEEMVLKNAPTFANDLNGQKKRDWVAAQISGFASAYKTMQSDDAIIHGSAVQVKGIDTSAKTFQVGDLLARIDKRMFMALQELPVLMGSNEGTTETHGSIQFEIYAKHIASIQRLLANLLEKLFSVALQVYGIAAKVIWVFNPIRSSDRLADAQAESVENQTAAFQRDQGWKDQDEVSVEITGHKAVGEPKAPAMPNLPVPAVDATAKPGKDNQPTPKGKVDANSGDTAGDGVQAGETSKKAA